MWGKTRKKCKTKRKKREKSIMFGIFFFCLIYIPVWWQCLLSFRCSTLEDGNVHNGKHQSEKKKIHVKPSKIFIANKVLTWLHNLSKIGTCLRTAVACSEHDFIPIEVAINCCLHGMWSWLSSRCDTAVRVNPLAETRIHWQKHKTCSDWYLGRNIQRGSRWVVCWCLHSLCP